MIDKAKPREISKERPQSLKGASNVEPQTYIQGSKARQGEMSGRMRKVVIVSIILAVTAMLGTLWYFIV